jgi:hypothetical protein
LGRLVAQPSWLPKLLWDKRQARQLLHKSGVEPFFLPGEQFCLVLPLLATGNYICPDAAASTGSMTGSSGDVCRPQMVIGYTSLRGRAGTTKPSAQLKT